jgi:hypothetical protein
MKQLFHRPGNAVFPPRGKSGIHSAAPPALLALTAAFLVASVGCDLGTPRSALRNVSQAAPKLEEFRADGSYRPYYSTGEMNRPRYFHRAIGTRAGLVYVFGGSDERGFSSLDTAEIFDQSLTLSGAAAPESGTGVWIDTNLEGDPITMLEGPRILFTVNEVADSDNRILIIGGTPNILTAGLFDKPEIFNIDTRTFEKAEGQMLEPRCAHTTVRLSSGDFLIAGGQIFDVYSQALNIIVIGGGGNQGGQAFIQIDVFPSTNVLELYSVKTGTFTRVIPFGQTRPATLSTPRGRAWHTMTRIAGPNNRLNSGDDLFVLGGGIQTLSAASGFAPRNKVPGFVGANEAEGMASLEVFDPQTSTFNLIASVRLNSARVDDCQIVNLGKFNDFTPDGRDGMGNAILVSGGNDDGSCPTAPLLDQLFIANFLPGAGPSQGLRFFEVEENQFLSHMQGIEYAAVFFPPIDPRGGVARAASNIVSLPRFLPALAPDVKSVQTWSFALAGIETFPVPGGCFENYDSPQMASGCVFDPFYNLAVFVNNGLSTRDLANQRRANPENFLGIVGYWFTLDGFIPLENTDNLGTTSPERLARNQAGRRIYCQNVAVAGEDGLIDTFDDRVLLTGGGRNYFALGGEPATPSAELLIPPRTAP